MVDPSDNLDEPRNQKPTHWLNASTEDKFAEVARIIERRYGVNAYQGKVERVMTYHQWSMVGDPPRMQITRASK